MKNEFVTHDIALALKKLGFNEKCLACYDEKGVFGLTVMSIKKYYTNSKEDTWNCAAPLYQQAFRWFREKYQLVGEFKYLESSVIKFVIKYLDGTLSDTSPYCKEYEEAELACLRRLIEIVKQNKNE